MLYEVKNRDGVTTRVVTFATLRELAAMEEWRLRENGYVPESVIEVYCNALHDNQMKDDSDFAVSRARP